MGRDYFYGNEIYIMRKKELTDCLHSTCIGFLMTIRTHHELILNQDRKDRNVKIIKEVTGIIRFHQLLWFVLRVEGTLLATAFLLLVGLIRMFVEDFLVSAEEGYS